MLPASNRGVGTAVGTPDTCNTPTGTGVDVPTPYANTGDHSQSVGFSPTVYVSMMNALSQSATVPSTSGRVSTGNTGFARRRVRGRIRTPSPAARTMAFIRGRLTVEVSACYCGC